MGSKNTTNRNRENINKHVCKDYNLLLSMSSHGSRSSNKVSPYIDPNDIVKIIETRYVGKPYSDYLKSSLSESTSICRINVYKIDSYYYNLKRGEYIAIHLTTPCSFMDNACKHVVTDYRETSPNLCTITCVYRLSITN
jgi:hypothetical protein